MTLIPDDCTATIKVINEEAEEPVNDARVEATLDMDGYLEERWDEGTTNANGTVDLEMWCGDWVVRITNYRFEPEQLTVESGVEVTLEVESEDDQRSQD